ncbi:MAG: hypothetical protein HRU35_03705 [Rickettsiaceae bacterium]|nr:hypothetical protein [Rickettsiaceae bacterium]
MKKLKKISTIIGVTTLLATSSAWGDTVSIAAKVGTLGIGVDARTPIYENQFFIRGGANYYKFSKNFDEKGIKYSGKLRFFTVPVLVDYHPFRNSGFKLSGGLAYNANEVKATATPTVSKSIGNKNYTPEQIGTINSKLKLGTPIAPIFTVGYDSSFVSKSSLSFNFEIGAMYSGTPKLTVTATGSRAQEFLPELKKDADKALNDAKKLLRITPVIAIGIGYSF